MFAQSSTLPALRQSMTQRGGSLRTAQTLLKHTLRTSAFAVTHSIRRSRNGQATARAVQVHPSAVVDKGARIGAGTHVWHFNHIMGKATIGSECTLGHNVFVGDSVAVGNHVKIQNNVSLHTGVQLDDYVFCGPSCVFTNVMNPRSEIDRREEFKRTIVRRGATIGANATVVCGITIGRYAFIGAGAVVNRDVPDYALVMGVPARINGWMSRHGVRLTEPDDEGVMVCTASGWRYRMEAPGVVRCLDWPEDAPLPQ